MSIILEQDIMKTLETLTPRDRDLKTIAITLNPNYIRGSDIEVQELIKIQLDNMVKQGLIRRDRIELSIHIGRNGHYKYTHRVFIVYSLNNKSKY